MQLHRTNSTTTRVQVSSWHATSSASAVLPTWSFESEPWNPKVVSLRLGAPRVRCYRYQFHPTPLATLKPPAAGTPTTKPNNPCRPRPPARIKPPDDIIKLQDRLYYLLQPSLDTLLRSARLKLPHDPFPYQWEGIGFLYARHAAVLADEMGLGKTVQAITTLRMLLHAGEIRGVLLICPKPLITNWQRELALWAGEIPANVVSGTASQRRWAWQRDEFPIRIANYETVLRDAELVHNGTIASDLVVLDEAQRIKNARGATSAVVRAIQRRRGWALTGTPIENSTDDLVGLFEFVASGLISGPMTPRQISQATSDYILRRTKDQVLKDLPPKLFRDALLELTPEQYDSYAMAENNGVLRLNAMGPGITIQHVFELVLRLKQICNFDPATGASSKLERLTADLEEVAASGQKAIVFSQWVGTLERLAERLRSFSPLCYHGRIPAAERERAIHDFRHDSRRTVLLISYGAGSVGLNLQFASYVFLFDRWWNPAIEDQAVNRAHRIGSAGPVTITRFLTPGTIEERIDDILTEKRELMSMVLDHQQGPRKMGLSQEEIFGLFGLGERR